jgi:hypothetical protein
MSCPGDKSVTNININDLSYNPQYVSNLTKTDINYLSKTGCGNYKGSYPSYKPVIYSLSVTTSNAGEYSLVYINGDRFQTPCIGTTYVNFGSYKNLPITYFSTTQISFVVPINAVSGNYSVIAVNVYNGNFSAPVNITYPGVLNYSNPVTYTIV